MREIKFRGKMLEGGNWIYGFYTKSPSGRIRILSTYNSTPVEVDPETVGQFIGLKDKMGRNVYEGDVINCSLGCPHEVIWREDYGGSYFGGMPAWCLGEIEKGYAWTGEEEVIGNIHDNPERLEQSL